jgi:hypothetical protein
MGEGNALGPGTNRLDIQPYAFLTMPFAVSGIGMYSGVIFSGEIARLDVRLRGMTIGIRKGDIQIYAFLATGCFCWRFSAVAIFSKFNPMKDGGRRVGRVRIAGSNVPRRPHKRLRRSQLWQRSLIPIHDVQQRAPCGARNNVGICSRMSSEGAMPIELLGACRHGA